MRPSGSLTIKIDQLRLDSCICRIISLVLENNQYWPLFSSPEKSKMSLEETKTSMALTKMIGHSCILFENYVHLAHLACRLEMSLVSCLGCGRRWPRLLNMVFKLPSRNLENALILSQQTKIDITFDLGLRVSGRRFNRFVSSLLNFTAILDPSHI